MFETNRSRWKRDAHLGGWFPKPSRLVCTAISGCTRRNCDIRGLQLRKRKLLSTESRGELTSLFRPPARPTTRARGNADSETAPGASRSLLFFGGETSGVTGNYGSAATVCPAWEKYALCEDIGSESPDLCAGVESNFGVACVFSNTTEGSDTHTECSPANGGAEAYLQMIAKVEPKFSPYHDECDALSASDCESNTNCVLYNDGGYEYCEANFAAVGDDISAALVTDGASEIAKNYFSLFAGIHSCDYLSQSECISGTYCTYDSEYGGCTGDIFPVVSQMQTNCAAVGGSNIGSFTTMANILSCDLRHPSTRAHVPTANGEDGDCGDFLLFGETCQPTCDDGYVSDGPTTCEEIDGNYVPSRAVCSLAIEYTTTVTLLINAQVVGHFVHGEFNPVTRAVNHAQLAYGDANEMPSCSSPGSA